MELEFDINIPAAFIILFAVISIAISYWLYYNNHETEDFTKTQKRTLASLRFSFVFLLLVLLINPLFTRHRKIRLRPTIILATDNSESLKEYKSQVDSIKQIITSELSRNYRLDYWKFGSTADLDESNNFSDTESAYDQLFEEINTQYINKNIGAVIMLGDGIYNTGQNPVNQVSNFNYPVYTIGLGDPTQIPDSKISDVRSNPSVFIENYFPLEVDISLSKLNGKQFELKILKGDKLIENRRIKAASDEYFVTEKFSIQATESNLQKYTITLQADAKEENKENNLSEFVIDVIDLKRQVLVISEGPHPDIGAIKSSLEKNGNYQITLINGNSLPENLNEYQLIVFNQFPDAVNSGSQILQRIAPTKIPVLFILGEKVSIPYLNNWNMGLHASPNQGYDEVQANISENFTLFKNNDSANDFIESFPPLIVPYCEYTLDKDLQVFSYQKIKGINTPTPLIALGSVNKRKTAFILGEGIWRWKIYNYYKEKNYKVVNEILLNIFNYLTINPERDNFKVISNNTYTNNEEIIITAELLNESSEMINSPEVNLTLIKDNNSEFNFVFDRNKNQYRLNIGQLEAGIYQFEAQVKLGDEQYSHKGSFTVINLNLEQQNLIANHQLLYQLAYETGGKFLKKEEINQIKETLKTNKQIKPERYDLFKQNNLLNLKWIFFLLILLAGMEWFLRKYWGIY